MWLWQLTCTGIWSYAKRQKEMHKEIILLPVIPWHVFAMPLRQHRSDMKSQIQWLASDDTLTYPDIFSDISWHFLQCRKVTSKRWTGLVHDTAAKWCRPPKASWREDEDGEGKRREHVHRWGTAHANFCARAEHGSSVSLYILWALSKCLSFLKVRNLQNQK